MHCGLKILLFWLCGAGLAIAKALPPGLACDAAGHAAEQAGALPQNMLLSIGYVESGRTDTVTGRVTPWPWTVNADGVGHYFADEQDAAEFALLAQSEGARDVDVGCFQISLQSHPDAFASMDAAFDPAANAGFAAHFLDSLRIRTGSWEQAIADYHSALPEFGLPYQRRVWAAWQLLGNAPADMEAALLVLPDPSVILQAPAARLVQVITMDETSPGDALLPHAKRWLPRVITP